MFKVENNIAIPTRRTKYPFADMNVNDSFFIATDNPVKERALVHASYRNWCFSRHMFIHDRKIIVRVVEGGLRVWRVS